MFTSNHSTDRIRIEVRGGLPLDPSRMTLTIDGQAFGEFTDDDAVELAEMLLIAAGQDDAAQAMAREVTTW